MAPLPALILKPGREKPLLRCHPWIFEGAVASVKGDPQPGDTVAIRSSAGEKLAVAAFSPFSQIRARVWSFNPEEGVDDAFFRKRLRAAHSLREELGLVGPGKAFRMVNAESDGLPGVVVDRYGDVAVCQFLSAGAHRWKKVVADHLMADFHLSGVFDRSSGDVMALEGLSGHTGPLCGAEPPEWVEITEGAARFRVDVRKGHKTGFYLDQRENRAIAAGFSKGKTILNCFSYTGAFGVQALLQGAVRVTDIELSEDALEIGRMHLETNGLQGERVEQVNTDVFAALRLFRDAGRRFDRIILDPPKFAATAAGVKKASRGYKDINLLAMKLLTPGGLLFTFSCSGHVSPELFQKIVAAAAVDSGRTARIVKFLYAGPDHPVDTAFPEGLYLKGLMLWIE